MRASRRRITKTAFPGELERAARGVAACSMRTARTRRSPSSRTPNAYGNGSHWRRDRRHRAARRPSPNPGARAIAAGAPTAATRRPLVCGKNHGEGFEHRGVLEGFDQAKLADVAPVRGRRRACGGSGSPHAMRAASRSVSTKAPSTARGHQVQPRDRSAAAGCQRARAPSTARPPLRALDATLCAAVRRGAGGCDPPSTWIQCESGQEAHQKEAFESGSYGGGAGNRTRVRCLILLGFPGVLEAAERLQQRSGRPVAPAWRDGEFGGNSLTIQGPKNQEHVRSLCASLARPCASTRPPATTRSTTRAPSRSRATPKLVDTRW